MRKTADNADARSRSRSSSLFCLRQNLLRSRFGAAKIFSKAKSNAKAAAKQVVSVSERQRRVAQPLGCICVICGFPHVSRAGNTHNKSIQEQSRTLCRLSINFAGLYRFISQITAEWRICILWTEKISKIENTRSNSTEPKQTKKSIQSMQNLHTSSK